MRHLSATAFEKAETQFWKGVQYAAKHQVGERQRIGHRMTHGTRKAVTAGGIMARQAPTARHRSGIYGMNYDGHIQLLSFSVKRKEWLIIQIFPVDGRRDNGTTQSQFRDRSYQLFSRNGWVFKRDGGQPYELSWITFYNAGNGVIVRAADAGGEFGIYIVVEQTVARHQHLCLKEHLR